MQLFSMTVPDSVTLLYCPISSLLFVPPAGSFEHLCFNFVIHLSAGGAVVLFGSEEQVRVSKAAGDV